MRHRSVDPARPILYGMSFCELIHQPVNPALIRSSAARAEKGDAADKILSLHSIIQRNLE